MGDHSQLLYSAEDELLWIREYERQKQQLKDNACLASTHCSDPQTVEDMDLPEIRCVDEMEDRTPVPAIEPVGRTLTLDPPLTDIDPITIEEACSQFNLNRDQRRTFRIVAEHSEQTGNEPLRLYVGGAGGTGKSCLIHALTAFFDHRGQGRRLRRASYMGVAARNINGMTLHTALQLSTRKRSAKTTNELVAMWRGVDYLLIDEVSMIGTTFLAQISEALSIAKGCSEAFGGISVIFAGDFAQLPPVGQTRLYSHIDGARVSTKAGQASALGKLLWLSVDKVVILTEIMRQGGDKNAHYRQILDRLRTGACTDDDYESLQSRLMNNVLPAESSDWHLAPFVVCDNEVKDALNVRATYEFAKRTGKPLMWFDSLDVRSGVPITDHLLCDHLLGLNSGTTDQRLGRLPLVLGMPLIIIHNFDVTDGVVNGCTGSLKSVRWSTDCNGKRRAHSCVIETEEALNEPLPNLNNHQVVALEDTVDLTFRHPHSGKKCKIRRTQLPVLPAFAMTVHKSQGRTMEKAIVDLEGCGGSESLYVMLSRVTSLDGLAILRPFSQKRIMCRPSEDSRREQRRLHLCNLVTMEMHGTAEEQSHARHHLSRVRDLPPLVVKAPSGGAGIGQHIACLEQLQSSRFEGPQSSTAARTPKRRREGEEKGPPVKRSKATIPNRR